MAMESINFPRGGHLHKNEDVQVHKTEEKDLFKIKKETKDSKQLLKKESKGVKRPAEPENIIPKKRKTGNVVLKSGIGRIKLLHFQDVNLGMLVLGCVQKVTNYTMRVGLPGGLSGVVHITAISDPYREQLEALASANGLSDLSETLSGLPDLFQPGMILPVKVTDVELVRRQIKLSINPKDVNHGMSKKNLHKDIVVFGTVSSCEDHGYMVDLGVKETRAFLTNKEAEKLTEVLTDGNPLSIGQSLWCRILVSENRQSEDNRTVLVTVDPKQIKEGKVKSSSGLVMSNLVPGMKVTAHVKEVREDALFVSFLSYTGTIYKTHLPNSVQKYHKKDEIPACILYINPTTKAVSLSALQCLVEYSGVPAKNQFPGLSIGDIVDKAAVSDRQKRDGLFFKLPHNNKGFASLSHLDDTRVDVMADSFKPGLIHKVRVIDYDRLNGLVLVSLKESVFKQKFMQMSDIKPGMIVQCTVKQILDSGVIVNVTNEIAALIPSIHLRDVPKINKPDKLFPVGKKLTCRALCIYNSKLTLTHKKSLVKTKLPIITSFKDVQLSMELDGVIVLIKEHSVLVSFFNDIKGLAKREDITDEEGVNLTEMFTIGQMIRCWVTKCIPEKQQIFLSFKWTQDNFPATSPQKVLQTGEIFKCRVVKKTEGGIEVEIMPSGGSGLIPMMHLSDSEDLCTLLMARLSEGDQLDEVMLYNTRHRNILTMKKTQLDAAKIGTIPKDVSSIEVGQIMPGVVNHHRKFGIFVEFAGGLSGHVHVKKIPNISNPEDLVKLFKIGQSVMFSVTQVNSKTRNLNGRLNVPKCYSGNVDDSLHHLEYFLADRTEYISRFTSGTSEKLKSYKVGCVVTVAITDITNKGVIGHLEGGLPVYATKDHLRGLTVEVGDKHDAVVLDILLTENCVEVIFDKIVVHSVKKLKDTPQAQARPGQVIKADVLLVRKDYVLVMLKNHTAGRLAYLPSKLHINDVTGPQCFSTDQLRNVLIQGEVEDWPIGVLYDWFVDEAKNKVAGTSAKGAKKSKQKRYKGVNDEMNVNMTEKDDEKEEDGSDDAKNDPFSCPVKVGQIVDAKVKKVRKFHIDVDVKGIKGRVHITEAVDKITNGATPLLKYRPGSEVTVKVIGMVSVHIGKCMPITRPDHKKTIPECSMKPSKLERETVGKVAEETPYSVGDSVVAFVSQFSKHNLWMLVSPSVSGRICELNLSEDLLVLQKVESHFKPMQGYNATVVGIDEDGPLELSLTGHKEIPTKNCVTKGRILLVKNHWLVIQLASGYSGSVDITNIRDSYIDSPCICYKPGEFVKCSVLRINSQNKTRCVLSLRMSRIFPSKSHITDPEVTGLTDLKEGQVLRGFVVNCKPHGVDVQLGRNILAHADNRHISEDTAPPKPDVFFTGKCVTVKILSLKGDTVKISLKDSDVNMTQKRKAEVLELKQDTKKKKTKVDSDSGVDLKQESDSDSEVQVLPKISEVKNVPRLSVSSSFCWDEEFSVPTPSSKDQMDNSEEEDDNQTPSRRKKLKHLTQKEEEEMIHEYERRQLEGDLAPQTDDDFDRLVLQSPNSSLVWLRYMAFHLETTQIDKARNIAERALKTISFREEQEKMNVWVAYLNLENLYGTPETLKKVFDRAIQYNEPIKVYQQLVTIYIKSEKLEEAEQLYNTMVRRFSLHKDIWLGFCLFFFKNGRQDSARKLLQKSLKSLDKKDHVDIICKFAQMEFRHGEAERGRTMFESIVTNYSKRTDLWSVFIDMVVKTGDISAARQLFERVIQLKVSARKMKFFFKKYVEFEKKHGDDTTVEQVKQKALDYVEAQGYVEN